MESPSARELNEGGDAQPSGVNGPGLHAPSGYLAVGSRRLDQWLRLVGPAPWLEDSPAATFSRRCAVRVYQTQSATLAIALLVEQDAEREDRAYLREVVRASLTRWQMTLGCNGWPLDRALRASALQGVIAAQVVLLLSETSGYESAMLLGDLERHLAWLTRRPPRAPWIEAATVSALAEGAALVRDTKLLSLARERLARLLRRQDDEGWFPERRSADIGRLSLTIDCLARLYRQNGWEELEAPLRRAVGFLTHFVHPDGTVGGGYNSCGTAFLSPYGVELLAPDWEEALPLLRFCRIHYGTPIADQFRRPRAIPEPPAPTIMLAAAAARYEVGSSYAQAAQTKASLLAPRRFSHAGLTTFSTSAYHAMVNGRKGGAIVLIWRDQGHRLEDGGITVTFAHRILVSAHADRRTDEEVSESTVRSHGILVRAQPRRHRVFPAAARAMHRLRKLVRSHERTEGALQAEGAPEFPFGTERSGKASGVDGAHRLDASKLTHDRFEREITFGSDWVSIRDAVHCRLPCESVVCQSPVFTTCWPFGPEGCSSDETRAPIFVEGGRHVEVTRLYRRGELAEFCVRRP